MDFVGPLPEEDGYNGIMTITDRFGAADLQLVPIRMDMTAEGCARLFFEKWFCENGLPLELISDRDKLFTTKFWRELHRLTGTKVKLSTAYHPQTDGASERTNKTLNQTLRFLVNRQQKGWVKSLPYVRFVMMNTVNASTGFTPFYLKTGRNPRTIPPLALAEERNTGEREEPEVEEETRKAIELLEKLQEAIEEARDGLIEAKTRQAHFVNQHRGPEDPYQVGDRVMLSTENQRRDFKARGQKRSAKLMPRKDGPYNIVHAFPERSEYTLGIPGDTRTFPGFHASQLRRFRPNDDELFPGRALEQPGPVVYNRQGEPQYEVEEIVDETAVGARGWRYKVRFVGWAIET